MPKTVEIPRIEGDLTGSLTVEKWIEWSYRMFAAENPFNTKAVFLHRGAKVMLDGYKTEFNNISTSSFIVDNFLSWPEPFQNNISRFSSFLSISFLEAFAKITTQAQEIDKLDFLFYVSVEEMDEIFRHEIKDRSEEFSECAKNFCRFQMGFPMLHGCSFIMLGYLYGETKVLEVSKLWMSNTTSNDLSEFVTLLDRWEEFKETPIDWTLNLLSESGSKVM